MVVNPNPYTLTLMCLCSCAASAVSFRWVSTTVPAQLQKIDGLHPYAKSFMLGWLVHRRSPGGRGQPSLQPFTWKCCSSVFCVSVQARNTMHAAASSTAMLCNCRRCTRPPGFSHTVSHIMHCLFRMVAWLSSVSVVRLSLLAGSQVQGADAAEQRPAPRADVIADQGAPGPVLLDAAGAPGAVVEGMCCVAVLLERGLSLRSTRSRCGGCMLRGGVA